MLIETKSFENLTFFILEVIVINHQKGVLIFGNAIRK